MKEVHTDVFRIRSENDRLENFSTIATEYGSKPIWHRKSPAFNLDAASLGRSDQTTLNASPGAVSRVKKPILKHIE
jgi:hypothetical protein